MVRQIRGENKSCRIPDAGVLDALDGGSVSRKATGTKKKLWCSMARVGYELTALFKCLPPESKTDF
jgi:hypothetical protein